MERVRSILLTLTLSAIFTGCTERTPDVPQERRNADSARAQAEAPLPEFPLPAFEEGRTLDTVLRVDDGRTVVVASLHRDSLTPPAARADRIELFVWNSKEREFLSVSQQTLRWASSYRLLAPGAGRRSPALLVFTDGGGNDPLASRGAMVLPLRAPTPNVLSISHGSPERMAAGDTLLLLTRARFLPPLASLHSGFEYVDAILLLEGDTLRDVRNEAGAAIVKGQARTALERYREALKLHAGYRYHPPLVMADSSTEDSAMAEAISGAPPEPSPLCLPAAAVLIALERAEEREERDHFWRRERPRLRIALSPDELGALDSLARGPRTH